MINYSHVYIWEIEQARKPATPEFVAACDKHLRAGGELIAAGARARQIDDEASSDVGLTFADDFSEGLRVVTSLWRHDAGRRRFLNTAVYASAAFMLPVRTWLGMFNEAPEFSSSTSSPSANAIRSTTRMFRRLDNLCGGGEIRATVVRYLDAEVAPTLRGATSEQLGAQTISAVAELTQLAGWLAYDACAHGLAQRYFTQALRLAAAAGDGALGAEILAAMSHQAIFLCEPNSAIGLANAARQTAIQARVPALVAEASVMVAQGYAQLRDETLSMAALSEAQSVFDNADRAHDPHWMSYFDEAYLAAISGHCFRFLGRQAEVERSARRSLDMNSAYVRGRLFNQLLLAGGHVMAQDVDEACSVGHQALDLMEHVSSARAITYVDRFIGELKPWHTDVRVKEFTERARQVTAQAA